MISREICNNNKPCEIYKRTRFTKINENSSSNFITEKTYSNIPKSILKNRELFETKLSMAMLSPKLNSFKINKFQRILNNIEDIIRSRQNEVSFYE